jgi:hypothetical protein
VGGMMTGVGRRAVRRRTRPVRGRKWGRVSAVGKTAVETLIRLLVAETWVRIWARTQGSWGAVLLKSAVMAITARPQIAALPCDASSSVTMRKAKPVYNNQFFITTDQTCQLAQRCTNAVGACGTSFWCLWTHAVKLNEARNAAVIG